MADVESGKTNVVRVRDDEVARAGRRTGWALVALSALMAAFCLSLMAVFAKEMADVAGDHCAEYGVSFSGDGSTCQYVKENWCAAINTAGGSVSVGCSSGATFADPETYTQNTCPQGCSGACDGSASDTNAAVASWKSQIKRLQQCYANSPKSRQCLPTVDTDGSLANYRGFKAAHPSLGLGGSTAFIARDAFLDACDAQLVYANRRQTGGYGVLAMMCLALLVWIIRCALTLRKPNYSKRPRETEMKPLTTFSEKKSFNNRYHPDSVWIWYSFVTAMFGFAVQLYSFYTPTTTDIRIPIAQGVWITLEIVTRAVLTLLDKFTLVEASAIFFDIGFSTVGFTALLEPFFEPKITDTLPEVDESITDYALAIRVVSFIYPLCASSLKVRDLYVDNFWPAPATAKAMTEKKRSFKRTIIKLVLLGLQLGAAMSVYGIMGNKELCHQFRTCARGSCTPNVPVGAPLDAELFGGGSGGDNMKYAARMISDDGTMIWRWGINSNTQMKMTKSGGKLYADLKFAIPNGATENGVSIPGNGATYTVSGLTAPTSACGTRYEVQCQEVNPRHSFSYMTGKYEWVKYNTSAYKFVARHDYEQTTGSPSCFGASTQWWKDNGMFVGGAEAVVGGTAQNPDLGFVFEEQKCWYTAGGTTTFTKYCLVAPAYLGVFKPFGRASVVGSWTWSNSASSMPTTWGTSALDFRLVMNENQIIAAGGSSSGSAGAGGCPTSFSASAPCPCPPSGVTCTAPGAGACTQNNGCPSFYTAPTGK